MVPIDNRWIIRVTAWQSRDGKEGQDRHILRWRDEIGSFAVVWWDERTADRDEWRRLGKASVLKWIHND